MRQHEVVHAVAGSSAPGQQSSTPGRLWFSRPATRWFEALPIGNGRLGGMVYSGDRGERIQLSESTAWSGAPADTDVSPTALEHLPTIRGLLLAGRYAEAQALAGEHLLGTPTSFGTNVPLPELQVTFDAEGEPTRYERSLDLQDAIVRTTFQRDGITIEREVFASHADGVIVVRLAADTTGALSFELSFTEDVIPGQVTTEGDTIRLQGNAFEELHSNGKVGSTLDLRAQVLPDDGTVVAEGNHLIVRNATGATILVAVGSDWLGEDPAERPTRLLEHASSVGYEALKQAHLDDYTPLMSQVGLDLGRSDSAVRELPTDERRALLAKGGEDPELLALYFQYGRYLTIAGSRADSPLPLALQGAWNDGRAAGGPWTNDFHLDINTQQNYWAAEITGLGECQLPLFTLIDGLRASGQKTATQLYGAPGWVSHTVSNAWGYSAPGWGLGWGLHVTSGIWISLQLWEHFEYNRDLGFLADRAYPVLRDAAEFFLAYLTEDPATGQLLSGPSDSPENWYLSPDGDQCSLSMGATCDTVLIEALFRICTEASDLLGVDEELRSRLEAAREKLPPFQIGKHGQLQEWLVDFDEAVPSHRHTSHLIALYPERQISPRLTPELARAAEVTIERRQNAEGWEQTEWVEANLMTYYARLLDGDLALRHLLGLIGDASEHNLMSYSAGGIAGAEHNIYSFDGNAGGTAGIAELLVQSTSEEIELLPALPSSWRDGSVHGLRARGGFVVDVTWQNGRLVTARITNPHEASVRVRQGDELLDVTIAAGATVEITPV
ncbi:alpha-L-fucosidase 2 [Kribbella orskensis]|uniref:Alpha-L-fucosidase 2 n=1 Tax=Kribbella orskensis TaxID=2512216 RepID=A0ABY2B7U4_9ACTN|nr:MULTISPECIES: glycoside hydrolase family 95 protein [Kribbella]TCN30563.1 alpha-L-fucosidase 2 [Kribbella sp. VKM Ac-2500]TCO11296.1 alpha-L-fucosidase 2 [Kribbella orskensis]